MRFAEGPRGHGLGEVASGVTRIPIVFVNAYFVDAPGETWVLVDTGLPGSAAYLRRVAEARYGKGTRPTTIVLTHGHFDHAGSAFKLAQSWNVPIYAHRLELPYLTGRSDYPPQDPTMGGAIAQMSRVFPHGGYDFGGYLRTLPDDGGVPGLPDWRWLHTPGHTPGHVSLWRGADRALLAGDAFSTMNLDSWRSQLTHKRELSRPPTPFTSDWALARRSVGQLAELAPVTVAAGHGRPFTGPQTAGRLRRFAERFAPPPRGRYIFRPAQADARGVVSLPPPVPDPLLGRVAGTALLGGLALYLAARRRA